ncbi:hypothetical protein C8R47DRAFT_168396 [Mycena vitilis]|nr:hypothetical protein C8R47DRAFT_168396 [Mycena vitilis]
MVGTSNLSLELIMEILDRLAVPMHEDPQALYQKGDALRLALAQCSTVCKAWSAYSQRLLFRRVILRATESRRRNSLSSFLTVIGPATEHARWLAESVVSLSLTPDRGPLGYESTCLVTVLLRTPNLRHLDAPTSFVEFDSQTLAHLRESGPRITSLWLEQDLRDSSKTQRILRQTIACFASIRILDIGCPSGSVLLPFEPPLNLPLACFTFTSSGDEAVGPYLASLLAPGSLQTLCHWSYAAVTDVLQTHGRGLRALSIKALEPSQVSLAEACPCVERFEILHFPDAATLARIPPTITTLVIRTIPPTTASLDHVIQALETFAHLKTLQLSGPCRSRPLETACKRRGIKLRIVFVNALPGWDDPVKLELQEKYIRV